MVKRIVVTALFSSALCFAYGQITIKGRVVDAGTGEPVIGANIRVDNSLTGGTTNARGEFEVNDLPDGKQTISITHVSYEPVHYSTSQSVDGLVIKLQESRNNLSQVVVTGTGTHRRMVDSPVPVNVLTARDLKEASITNLEDALTKLTPSFSFTTSGMGTEMMLNGLNSDYILVLENGRKLIGDDALQRIDMDNVKRVEILGGSASALYGSDAIGGVINIITDDSNNKVDASSTTKISDRGRISESVNLDLNLGKVSSFTSYQRKQSDGWQLSPVAEVTDKKTGEVKLEPTDKQAFTGYKSNTVSQRFEYAPTDKAVLHVQGAYYDFLNDRPVTEYKYNMFHQNYSYGAGLKYKVNRKAYIDADFYADNYTSAYDYIAKSGDFVPGDREVRKRQAYYNGNVKGIVNLNKKNKLSTGFEYIDENLTSESDNISGKSLYTLAVFAQDEWKISKRVSAVVGLRYIYNETFGDHFTPTASVMYKEGGFRGRFSFATGFRTPTLSELYSTDIAKTKNVYTIGNINLKPEESKNFTLNLEYVHSRFTVSATAFVNNVSNMINYRTLSPEEAEKYGDFDEVQQRDNIDKARVKGVTFNVNAYLGAGFSMNGGYSLTDAKNLITDTPLDKSIKHAGNLTAMWAKTWGLYRLNINVNGRAQSKRYSETYDFYSPKFMLWDLNTSHTFNLRSVILDAGVGVENLFDYKDDRPWNTSKPYATVTPGRSFYGRLTIRFKH